MKTVLQQLALKSERFRLEWVSVSEEARFATIIKDMTKEIKKLGPNPLKVGGISNG